MDPGGHPSCALKQGSSKEFQAEPLFLVAATPGAIGAGIDWYQRHQLCPQQRDGPADFDARGPPGEVFVGYGRA